MRGRVLVPALVALCACGGGGDDDGAGASDGGADDRDGGTTDPAVIFDESTILTYELEVEAEDWAYLNEHATEEQYVPATLRLGDEVFEDARLRYKGSYGSLYFCFTGDVQTCDKLSMKVSFNEVDPEGRFHGLKKLNFHSMEADPTRMHDAIGYKLFRDHDVPAPHTAYARVKVNGDLIGLYVVVEQVDGRFTRSTFGDEDGGEGNLYKEVWPSSLEEQPYLDALETNEDESPSADKMVRFAQALADAGEAGFAGVIDDWMEPGQLMRYMAIARLIDSWDDIVAWYCAGGPCYNHNYYWYESTTEDRVWLVAWDIDHTFEEPSPIRSNYSMPDWDDVDASCDPIPIFLGVNGQAPACDPFIHHMATQLWDEYAEDSQALLDGDFSLANMNARIDELAALIEDAVREDPNSPGFAAWETAVNDLRNIVAAKRDHVAGKL